MELDKRILEGKKPLNCFDTEIAKQFIGKKGYFSNYLNVYTNLCNMEEGVLHSLDEQHGEAFVEEYAKWKFFLPAEWVKEPEKKYRPFSLAEWIDQHEIGEVIHYRDKDYKQEFCVMYSGYIIDEGEDVQDVRTIGRIVLMFTGYFLEELFKDYEICINGEWHPFGVMEQIMNKAKLKTYSLGLTKERIEYYMGLILYHLDAMSKGGTYRDIFIAKNKWSIHLSNCF